LRIALLEQGFVYVSATCAARRVWRKWHEAGTKLKKQNVFDDFIAPQNSDADKITSPQRLAIHASRRRAAGWRGGEPEAGTIQVVIQQAENGHAALSQVHHR